MANILWIDDKAEAGDLTRLGFNGLMYFIEQNGHKINIASLSEEIELAVEKYSSYDVIILDVIMDALSASKEKDHQFGGFDVIDALENNNSKTPIIILSVMREDMIYEEAERRSIDLTRSSVKKILRKGRILPSELARIVQDIINENNAVIEG